MSLPRSRRCARCGRAGVAKSFHTSRFTGNTYCINQRRCDERFAQQIAAFARSPQGSLF
jgi:hypothetical protein